MKTSITNKKNNLIKLTKVLGIGALMSLGLTANSQSCIANYTYINDTSNISDVTFTNTSSIGSSPLTYFWDFGDGTSSTLENPNHVYTNNGNYAVQVCLTVSDGNNTMCTYCDSVVIGSYFGNTCQAVFYTDQDTNSVNGVNFWDYSGGSPTSFSWDFGDNTTSTLQNPNHVYSSAGTYYVCLTIVDLNGTTCSYCDNVVAGPNYGGCQAYFYAQSDSSSVNGLNFSNYSFGNSTVFAWDFGDGSTSNVENPNHVYAAAGTYQVCLTISDSSNTCQSTYCDVVTVGGQNGGGCQAYFYSSIDSSNTNLVNFSNYSNGTPTTFAWDFGDNTTSNLENPNHVYAAAGTYQVCLTIGDSSGVTCVFCDNIITGNQGGTCQANFYVVNDSIDPTNITVYDYSTCGNGGNCQYLWDFGDGTTSTAQYFTTHIYPGNGPYYLCLTIGDGNGCSSTHCDSIYAGRSGGITLNIHNQLAGIDESKSVSTVLENYPNPFSGSTTVNYSISKNAIVELTIVDLMGNKVAVIEKDTKSAGSYTAKWNAENVTDGMYLIRLKVNDQLTTKKIIITK